MVSFKQLCCFTVSNQVQVADCGSKLESLDDCKYSWEQIEKWTSNFSTVVGSGGVSTVYLARLPDSSLAAVKIQLACTQRLARIHDQELQILAQVNHPNIVTFVGHCDDREEERVLLFEYASNGTLHDNLVLRTRLTWKTRRLIAFQLASALEYLHGMEIIHGDIKASNILLDQQLNCKLCDFGSAGFSITTTLATKTRIINGSQGYLDPDYLKTGLVSKKMDIYSFGVVVLELITGREAFCVERGELLTEIVGPVVRGAVGVEEVVDSRLRSYGEGLDLDLEEVKAMVSLAGMCIGCSMIRPSAKEIVDKFQTIF